MKLHGKRLAAFLVGLALMALGSLAVSGYGQWPRAVGEIEFFPYPTSGFGLTSDDVPARQGDRTLRLESRDTLVATFKSVLPSDDRVIIDVTAGKFRDMPGAFVGLHFGYLSASDADGDVVFDWSPPTVEKVGDGQAVLIVKGTSRPISGRLEVQASWAWCMDSRCRTKVEGKTTGPVVAISPPSEVTKQTATGFEVRSSSVDFSTVIDDNSAPSLTKQLGPSPAFWSNLASLWRQALLFVPWLIGFAWLRSRLRVFGATQDFPATVVSTHRAVLLAAVVTSAVLMLNWFQSTISPTVDRLRSDTGRSGAGTEWIPFNYPATVAAIVAVLALWVWRATPPGNPSPAKWSSLFKILVLLFGLAAVALLGYTALDHWEFVPPDDSRFLTSTESLVASSLGVILAAVGALAASFALGKGSGWARDGLCAASVIVTLGLASTVYSVNASMLSGILTLVILVMFVSALIWTILGTVLPGTWRQGAPRWWISVGVFLFALAFAVPPTVSVYSMFPVSPYDALDVSFAVEPFIRVGLIAGALVLLGWIARSGKEVRVWRPLAVGTIALLLLRPESVVAGVPVSFGVGLALTLSVLVRPRGSIVISSLQSEKDGVRRLLDELRAIRLKRELGLALRKRIRSGDLSSGDRDKIVETVTSALDAPASPPDGQRRHELLGQAGMPQAMQRALLATAVSGVAGVVFSLPLLAGTISGLDVRNSNTFEAILTSILSVRFPFYGFVFGYFLPYFRGHSGLAKAVRFFIVLGASESLAILLPYNPADDLRGAVTVLLVQLAALCAVLGVGADLMAIHTANEGVDSLADLYNMSRLALWSSGILASAATALVTAMLGAALAAAAESVLPPAPPPIIRPINGASQ
ncbi:hypothetical protein [Arthrobacter sp. HS15c]|uniref:hypothetical protein n=1 Tax=Arthrobacter sp. HS15c TaxID=3230279 RepID=UPI003464EB55